MLEPPRERVEVTDMCFCLIRCEAMAAATRITLISSDVPTSPNRSLGPLSVSLNERIKLIKELEARLQGRYVRHCNSSSPLQLMTTLLSRLIVVHFWWMTCYPRMRHNGSRDHTTSEPPQRKPGAPSNPPTNIQ